MSLRQFISSRAVVRALTAVRDTAALSWHEAAGLLGLHEDLCADPRHRTPAEPVTVLLAGHGHRGRIDAENVHCFAKLKWRTAANAPPGSTERCTEGCRVEADCACSALRIDHRERKRL